MALDTHTIQISANVFQRLRIQAQIDKKTVDEVAEQTLSQALPPALDDVPEKWRADLVQMQAMSDDMIWRIAKTNLSTDRVSLYDSLNDAKVEGELSSSEQEQLEILQEESNMLMVRKSYAWLLLKSRGYDTPDPYSQSTYE